MHVARSTLTAQAAMETDWPAMPVSLRTRLAAAIGGFAGCVELGPAHAGVLRELRARP